MVATVSGGDKLLREGGDGLLDLGEKDVEVVHFGG
jgi:hypothetical protein